MKKVIAIISIILFFCKNTFCQKLPDLGVQTVRIVEPEMTIVAELETTKENHRTKDNLYYSWYSANQIHLTQGGYSGKLLNGKYTEYYPNKMLKQQGTFIAGLKNSTWKEWDEKGILKEQSSWEEGQRQGEYAAYDQTGKIITKGQYRKNLPDGTFRTYGRGDSVTVTQYRNGVIYIPGQSLLRRLYPFKRRLKKNSLNKDSVNLKKL